MPGGPSHDGPLCLIRTALRRGLRKRCPHCGEGPLFSGWSQLERCSVCGWSSFEILVIRGPSPSSAIACRGRTHRVDLFRSRAFTSGARPDDPRRGGGVGCVDDPKSLGRGDRAALLIASVLARSCGPDPTASCEITASVIAHSGRWLQRKVFLVPLDRPIDLIDDVFRFADAVAFARIAHHHASTPTSFSAM